MVATPNLGFSQVELKSIHPYILGD